jgi:hypothetical protein
MGRQELEDLEALTEILTFLQSNSFAPGSLVFMMLATKKESAN